ncbi:DUF559 domain-containing protein [Agromyces sp. SYSU K20354]|uniref:endonuclease domain-containing protein n=1 Tax=Agromyces cavernae TaxID=2898659 RepID=UPI001E3F473F|nr:DUF559 domain-containing protein [Agromyces cavernae]MCD2441578.1 DUF559 domain-containing protein [Agromyces cavernae]
MRDLGFDLRRLGGFATRTQLRAMGHSARGIRSAVDDRRCLALTRSWVSNTDANPEGVRALRLRGMLGGESALRSYGIWVSHDTGLCVATTRTASRRLPLNGREYRVWREFEESGHGEHATWRVGVVEALAQFLPRITDASHAAATLDSALHLGLVSPAELTQLIQRMPRRIRRLRNRLDAAAESGLETLLRLAIVKEGWRVESQVSLAGVGRVDLLVDGWLVIEADGSKWHDGHEATVRDRGRNTALVLRGYRWHRFGHGQIMDDLGECVEVIRALLASGRPMPH